MPGPTCSSRTPTGERREGVSGEEHQQQLCGHLPAQRQLHRHHWPRVYSSQGEQLALQPCHGLP